MRRHEESPPYFDPFMTVCGHIGHKWRVVDGNMVEGWIEYRCRQCGEMKREQYQNAKESKKPKPKTRKAKK